MTTIDDVVARLRAEYLEMPGLRLKPDQVQRLCGVEPSICQMVLDALVAERFLCVKPDGLYARVTDGPVGHPQAAKAGMIVPWLILNERPGQRRPSPTRPSPRKRKHSRPAPGKKRAA